MTTASNQKDSGSTSTTKDGTMSADTHSARGGRLSPDERLRVYELLYLMNSAFHAALTCILLIWDEFKPCISEVRMEQLEQLVKECQGEANGYLLERFEPIEKDDRDMFGRVRKAREEGWWEMRRMPLPKPAKPKEPKK